MNLIVDIALTHVRSRARQTVVAVTHDLALAGRMDRRIQLADGAIVADDGIIG